MCCQRQDHERTGVVGGRPSLGYARKAAGRVNALRLKEEKYSYRRYSSEQFAIRFGILDFG
ncbi:hypothetical protein RchiOBHm_Chr5g0022621 [Rosa chinensis]|uniref:Uncharacterized protein n=1 Tax=Rosa chinensis TaxID=74649 RepID=A0A2P6Q7V0_ROSCH|nr:hypothetical protein RchiOBHm_Chr5g0022621 [Rosa chinensis]